MHFVISNALSLTSTTVFGMLFILLGIGLIALTVLLHMRDQKQSLVKPSKRGFWIVTAMSAFTVLAMVYWQLWAFRV